MSTPALELDDVEVGFGGAPVLRGMSYTVGAGEIAALVGLNGAGKSVSLAVAAGVLRPTSGRVLVGASDVTASSPEARTRLGVATVLQTRNVFAALTVEQNLRLGRWRNRRDRHGTDASVDAVLDRFPELRGRLRDRAGSLSTGLSALLALARALVGGPSLLLVDEPSAALSPDAVDRMAHALVDANADGLAVLLVEQNVALALEVAHRVHVVERGAVVYSGRTAELDLDRVGALLGVGPLLAHGGY